MRTLGVDVSERTVSRLLERCPEDLLGRSSRAPKAVVSITDMSGVPRKRPCAFFLQVAPSLEEPHNAERPRWSRRSIDCRRAYVM